MQYKTISLFILIFLTRCINLQEPANKKPKASFTITPAEGDTSTVFQFDTSNCSDNEDPDSSLQIRWSWEGDETWDTEYSTTKTIEHKFKTNGYKSILLQVKDSEGSTNITSNNILIETKPVSLIQSFDTQLDSSYWKVISSNENNGLTFIIQKRTDNAVVPGGAMMVDWSVENGNSWGGFTKIEHFAPGSQVLDWSIYDSISFWYNNSWPSSLADRVHFRFELYDVSNAPENTSNSEEMEIYFSFQYILDNDPGWNEWKMPLINGDFHFGEAFIQHTDWGAGIDGNRELNPDRIKGFAFEFSITGSGKGDVGSGTILIDELTLKGRK